MHDFEITIYKTFEKIVNIPAPDVDAAKRMAEADERYDILNMEDYNFESIEVEGRYTNR